MADVLCLRLFGPMAAWGTPEAGNVRRPSQRHPSRGAVLGIVAAALGVPRGESEGLVALRDTLSVAVASHGRRRVTEEFRTSQTGLSGPGTEAMTRRERVEAEARTTLTYRQNVEDGLWRVFLAARAAGADLRRIEAALRRPAFELRLGRREYPLALPPDPRIVTGGLWAATVEYPPVPTTLPGERSQLHALYDAMRRRLVGEGGFELRWDTDFPGAPERRGSVARKVADDPYSRLAWTFREREELSLRVPPPEQDARGGTVTSTSADSELRFFAMGDE